MFSSRASSNFANTRTSSAANQAKNFTGQGGASTRIFKGPTPSSYPYGVSAHFDVGYYNIDPSHQPRSRNSWFNMFPDPKNPSNSSHQKSSFSIYPGMSKDMFIYEPSNSEFSSPATSLTAIPYSPAFSTDSLDTIDSVDAHIDAPPSQGRPPSRSSTPASSAGSASQSGLKGILRNTPQSQNTTADRYGQPQSFVPFMAPEREAELDHISRMNTEINSSTRFPPGVTISVEHRDIPTQIYRDMPLSSSPEPYDDPPFNHETSRDRRRSYAPIMPPAHLEPSISQSTTSTLDPSHPLLQPPSSAAPGLMSQRPLLFEARGSDSDGSTVTIESGRRSSPPNLPRPRADSGPTRHINSTTLPGGPRSVSPKTIGSATYHQGSPSRVQTSAEPPVMPVAPLGSLFPQPPPHAPPPVQTAASDGALPIPPPRSRPQAVTLTTVESGSSSASERTLHDSPPRPEYAQRNSNTITSTRGSSAPTSSSRPRSSSISSTAPPPFSMIPPVTSRSSPPTASQVTPSTAPTEQRQTTSPPRTTVTTNNNSVIPDPYFVEETVYPGGPRSRTPGPKRSHSDGDNPIYAGATIRSATPFRTDFAPNVTFTNPMQSLPPPPPEPRRRYSDDHGQQTFSRGPVSVSNFGPPPVSVSTRSVRWNKNLICPSPVLPCNRRKGWYNRRGDQLWTNSGSYKGVPAGQEYPPDLDCYPEFGEGWMNEEGVKIDMMHRLVPKAPLRSALKQPRASNPNHA